MASALIDNLLNRGVMHPLTRSMVQFPISKILMEPGLLKKTPEILRSVFPKANHIAMISDANTHRAAAEVLEQSLDRHTQLSSIILPGNTRPSIREVRHIREMSQDADVLLAVGSGTINDLVKYASFKDVKPYAILATAPSMNGYASANASIEDDEGFKTTLPAQMPKAILMDLDVMAKAPKKLILSGLGDSICRSTAQADWLLSYFLLGTDYISTPFEWLTTNENRLFSSVDRLVQGGMEAIEILCENLILSGLGMTLCGGSYPASQGEHLIAHYMEMIYGEKVPHTLHGQQIGVTTLTMATLQEKILKSPPPVVHSKPMPDEWFREYFGEDMGPKCRDEYRMKEITPEKANALNARIEKLWPEMVTQLKKIMVPQAEIKRILESAGADTTSEDLGWPKDLYKKAITHAQFTRRRFTFLDLAWLAKS